MPTNDETASPEQKCIAPGFDLLRLRCAAEVELRAIIEKDADFHKRLMERAPQGNTVVDGRLSLIKNDYRVDRAITPALDELREQLQATLRLAQPIDMYVRCSPEPNAFCAPTRKGTRLVMCVHSALLDLLSPAELLFVMAHEVGHALFEHTKVPKIDFDDPAFSPLEVIRTRALGRRQEVSCDRVGLVACQDVNVAGSALLKIMSGVSDRWLRFDATAFARQFDQIADMAEVAEMDDAASTHPIIAIRAKALLDFSESQLYAEAISAPAGKTPTDQVEKVTRNLLAILEPDLSEIESASEKDAVNRLLVSGAMAMIASDGTFDPGELKFLRARVDITDEMIDSMRKPDFVERTLKDLSSHIEVLNQKLTGYGRANLLKELTDVALSTGGYADAEVRLLAHFGESMNIPEKVFQNILRTSKEETPPAGAGPAVAKPAKRTRKSKAVEGQV